MNTQKAGFTLLELIVVIVIIAILAIISLPKFTTMKESSFDQESIANLKLIQAAEKIYKMETAYYVSCADAPAVNSWLRLSIPTTSPNWNYKVVTSGSTFTGKTQRNGADSRVKCIDENSTSPYTTGCAW